MTRTPLLRSKGQRSTYWGWGILWRASHRAMFTFDWQPSICTPVGYCQQGRSETSKGQMSRSPGRFTNRGVNASGSCSSDRCNVLTVGTYCCVAVCRRGRLGSTRRFGAHRGRRGAGAYCGGRPPTACCIGCARGSQLRQTSWFVAICWVASEHNKALHVDYSNTLFYIICLRLSWLG